MGQTITEKILARAAGRDGVIPGEYINAKFDVVFFSELSGSPEENIEKTGVNKVFDPDRVYITMDHHVPSSNLESATSAKEVREFVQRFGIKHFFEMGRGGIMHAIFAEQGLIVPGDMVAGADSHSVTAGALGAFSTGFGSVDSAVLAATGEIWLRVPESIRLELDGKLNEWVSGKDLILHIIGQIGTDGALYRSMEFAGAVAHELSMDDRFTICNMAVEAGGKNGIFEADKKTVEYVEGRAKRPYTVFNSDLDARYSQVIKFDCSKIGPQVAMPSSPGNVKPAREIENVRVDQVVIGSCTNGRMSDLRIAAEMLKGREVAPHVRAIIIPATQEIWKQAEREGLLRMFADAGCVVSPPTCGPCFGGHMGIIADGEVALSTTNRNFRGRMGHPRGLVYLSSPATAAASAVKGKITDPRDV